jgi:hypothetical protein
VPETLFPPVEAHVFDTSAFILFERRDAVDLLERAVTERSVELRIPERVYAELTPEELPYAEPPVERAIEDEWVRVLGNIEYANPVVSETMDLVRRYIAAASDKHEDDVEQADAALGGATATLFESGTVDSAAVYTTDRAAGRGLERALAEHGYEDRLTVVDAFDFFETIERRYRFQG